MYYLKYFFIFSLIGHFLESFVYTNGESGILYGPWTPIYGIGSIIIIFIYNLINNKFKLNKINKIIIVFLIWAILLSIIELLGGYLIEWIFNITFWDYSNYKFNIGKYAALEMSLIWGLSSILLVFFLKPVVDKIKIPKSVYVTLISIFIFDLFFTLYFKNNFI